MPNTFLPDICTPVVEITKENEHLLRTRYEARSEKELPVLMRYFPAATVKGAECTWFDLILYSREQILKENAATGKRVGELDPAPWRLISIKAQDVPFVQLCFFSVTEDRQALRVKLQSDSVYSDWRLMIYLCCNRFLSFSRYETPMQPITIMRNALISEGGSGVSIDRTAYGKSVDYWSKHAPIA